LFFPKTVSLEITDKFQKFTPCRSNVACQKSVEHTFHNVRSAVPPRKWQVRFGPIQHPVNGFGRLTEHSRNILDIEYACPVRIELAKISISHLRLVNNQANFSIGQAGASKRRTIDCCVGIGSSVRHYSYVALPIRGCKENLRPPIVVRCARVSYRSS
jgi:hypothetical protein